MLARLYKRNQRLNIIEIIVTAENTLPMIGNTVLLVAFKAVQPGFDTISVCKYSKPIGLDFGEKPFFAVCLAEKAVIHACFQGTAPIFAPFLIGAVSGVTAAAMFIFRT